MKFFALIPARGGSKSIPRKNLALIGDKPLIFYILETAKNSNIDRVFVSTEDSEIKEVASNLGVEVIDRPKELSTNKTPTLPVLQHFLKDLRLKGVDLDYLVLLYPTSPLLTVETLNKAVDAIKNTKKKSLLSIVEDTRNFKIWEKRGNKFVPKFKRVNRQYVPKVYRENGTVYIAHKDLIEQGKLVDKDPIFLLMREEESIDIDTPFQLRLVKLLLKDK